MQELLDLVKGQTGMKADRLLKPHKGRRYRVRGRVETVDDYMIDGVHMNLETADGVTVILWFDKSRRLVELLETLDAGDEISASGMLRYASNHITLEKCSLDGIGTSA